MSRFFKLLGMRLLGTVLVVIGIPTVLIATQLRPPDSSVLVGYGLMMVGGAAVGLGVAAFKYRPNDRQTNPPGTAEAE